MDKVFTKIKKLLEKKEKGYLEKLEKIIEDVPEKEYGKIFSELMEDPEAIQLLIDMDLDPAYYVRPDVWKYFFSKHKPSSKIRKYVRKNAGSKVIGYMENIEVGDKVEKIDTEWEMGKITLDEGQIKHVEKCLEILSKYPTYFDLSKTGTGKTPCAFKIAELLGYKLFVVCTKTTVDVWEEHTKILNMDDILIEVISYDSLKGSKSKWCKDGGKPRNALKKLIEKGKILFIFDEAHYVKNAGTGRSLATSAIIDTIIDLKSNCKIGLLSATLEDFEVNALSFVRFTLCTSHPSAVVYEGNKPSDTSGLDDIIKFSKSIDKEKTKDIVKAWGEDYKKPAIIKVVFELFSGVICPAMRSSMLGGDAIVIHGYFPSRGREYADYKAILGDLETEIESKKKREGVMERFTEMLESLEKAKLPMISRLVRKQLENEKHVKIVIFVDFLASIKYLLEKLDDFDPLVIQGSTDIDTRNQNIKSFQTDSRKYRLIILTTKTGGAGISLNDTTGEYRRVTYATCCTYSYQNVKQMFGRTDRKNNKSTAEIYVVHLYDRDNKEESLALKEYKILENHYKKRKILDSVSGRDESEEFETKEEVF